MVKQSKEHTASGASRGGAGARRSQTTSINESDVSDEEDMWDSEEDSEEDGTHTDGDSEDCEDGEGTKGDEVTEKLKADCEPETEFERKRAENMRKIQIAMDRMGVLSAVKQLQEAGPRTTNQTPRCPPRAHTHQQKRHKRHVMKDKGAGPPATTMSPSAGPSAEVRRYALALALN